MDGILYEQPLLSPISQADHPGRAISSDRLSPNSYSRSPTYSRFLGLEGYLPEKNLWRAPSDRTAGVYLELGRTFCISWRQKQLLSEERIADRLLFFTAGSGSAGNHGNSRSLVPFRKQVQGEQMELYLRWLKKHETLREQSPIGLILCVGNLLNTLRLPELDKGDIRVADI